MASMFNIEAALGPCPRKARGVHHCCQCGMEREVKITILTLFQQEHTMRGELGRTTRKGKHRATMRLPSVRKHGMAGLSANVKQTITDARRHCSTSAYRLITLQAS